MSVRKSRAGMKDPMAIQEVQAEIMDEDDALGELYVALKPILRELIKHGDVNGIIKNYSGAAILELIDLMRNSKSDHVRKSAAKDIAYMAGLNPVNKTASLNVDYGSLAMNQKMALLASKLEKMPKEKLDLIFNALSNRRDR